MTILLFYCRRCFATMPPLRRAIIDVFAAPTLMMPLLLRCRHATPHFTDTPRADCRPLRC